MGNRIGGVWIDKSILLVLMTIVLAAGSQYITGCPNYLQSSPFLVRIVGLIFMLYFYELWVILLLLIFFIIDPPYGIMSPWLITIILCRSVVLPCILLFRDGMIPCSPGRWLTGLRVVDIKTGEPISVAQSIKRNIIVFIPSIILVFLHGYRLDRHLGDRWAGTKVIIRKKRHLSIFSGSTKFCEQCQYDLSGNITGICPECGHPVIMTNPHRHNPPTIMDDTID